MGLRNDRSKALTRFFSFKVLVLLAFSLIIFDAFFGTEIGQENVACRSALRKANLRKSLNGGRGQNQVEIMEQSVLNSEKSSPKNSPDFKLSQKFKGVNVIVHQFQRLGSSSSKDVKANVSIATRFAATNDSKYGKPLFGKSYIIIYNAVPKTASRTLETGIRSVFNIMNLTNKCLNIPTHLENSHNESAVTSWFRNYKAPAFIRGHAKFAPVEDPGVVYINIVRDPIDRLISHFYFDYYGDVKLPKNSTNVDLKKCILTPGTECHDRYKYFKSVTLEAICGYDKRCTTPSNFSLERAKSNLEDYAFIGLTEDIDNTMKILEMTIPGMLAGLNRRYKILEESVMAKFKTTKKIEPDQELRSLLRRELAYEYEFYNYAKSRFEDVKERFLG